jgi:hypothetical protein
MQIIPHVALYVIMEMKETSQQKMEFPFFALRRKMVPTVRRNLEIDSVYFCMSASKAAPSNGMTRTLLPCGIFP